MEILLEVPMAEAGAQEGVWPDLHIWRALPLAQTEKLGKGSTLE
jgi:hypothetical protein